MVTAIVRTPYQQVTFAGNVLTNVLSVSATFGFDQRVPEARVTVPVRPGTGGHLDSLVIAAGASIGTSRTIFSGRSIEFDYRLWPRSVTIVGRGELYKALTYVNEQDPNGDGDVGLFLEDFVGASSATDQDIVAAVLTQAGVSFSGGNIGGTGQLLGTQAPDVFLWRVGQSALDYIDAIDKISAVADPPGFYRTFETVGGVIHRSLIGGRPRGTADATYTEGTDISSGGSSRSVLDLYNFVRVTGYDYGDGSGASTFTLEGSNDFQPITEPHVLRFGSQMIERETMAEAGDGMSCEEVAIALSADVNREVVRIQGLDTPKDDHIGPGATVLVQAAGGLPDRLGIGEKMWVQSITIVPFPSYHQTYTCLGGGPPDGDPSLPAVPQ
jgi:hypothetical protein